MSEQFRSVDQARAGPRKVGVRIHCKDAAVPDGRQIAPTRLLEQGSGLLERLSESESARHHDENFRGYFGNFLP